MKGGSILKRLVVLIAVLGLFLTMTWAFAGEIPSSLAGVFLGQKAPKKQTINNVTVYGLKGDIRIDASNSGVVERVVFNRYENKIDSLDKTYEMTVRKMINTLGKTMLQEKETCIWGNSARKLTLKYADADAVGDEGIEIYLESPNYFVMGTYKDGFKFFFERFKKALRQNDKGTLYSSFQKPINDNCGGCLSFSNRKGFETKYGKLFSNEAREAILEGKSSFRKREEEYHIWGSQVNFVAKKISGKWVITFLRSRASENE
jgi:hypothetical protein